MLNVSVVIPSYQHGALLERAVCSALDCGAGEVVIVNDASTDNTDIIGQYLHANEPRVLYMRNPFHAGVIYSRNRAIHDATYPLIVPLDADDVLLTIAPLVEAYQPGTWISGGWKEDGKNYQCSPIGMLHSKAVGWITMLFSKGDWLEVGGYDTRFAIGNEGWAFQRALYQIGIKPIVIPDIIFERNSIAPNTERSRQWNHVITPLIDEFYPYPK
jgi:glycosyltransferase involved in cell wall biosynthesis